MENNQLQIYIDFLENNLNQYKYLEYKITTCKKKADKEIETRNMNSIKDVVKLYLKNNDDLNQIALKVSFYEGSTYSKFFKTDMAKLISELKSFYK